MKGKVVLITGGSRGIGAEAAILAASKGWDVCMSYRCRTSEAADVVNKIKGYGRRALAFKADIGSEKDIVSLFKSIDSEFGRLDALVNNAGIITPQSQLADMTATRI